MTAGLRRPRMDQMLPDNVQDNLDAAANPIMLEPTVNDQAIGRQMRFLMEAGYSPEEAAASVQEDVRRLGRAGGVGGGADASWERAQGLGVEAAAGRRANAAARSARQDAFEGDYNAETMHPEWGYDVNGNPARLGRVDIGNPNPNDPVFADDYRNRARTAENNYNPVDAERSPMTNAQWDARDAENADYGREQARRRSMVGRRVPGPRTMSGLPPEQGAPLYDTDEYGEENNAAAYADRGATHEGEAIRESQQDKDMRARGMVPVVLDDGSVSYMVEAVGPESAPGLANPRGGVGRRGYRRDMDKAVEDGRYVVQEMQTPDGRTVQVYARSAKDRAENGVIKVPGQSLADRQTAYQVKKDRMADEREQQRQRWRARTYLAGGGQNINDANRPLLAALAAMPEEERREALREMMPINHDRAMIQAQSAQHAMDLARSALHNSLQNGLTTPQQQLAVDQARRAQLQEMYDWGQQQIDTHYANRPDSWFPGRFTESERDELATSIARRFGISIDAARDIVDGLAAPYDNKPAPADADALPPVAVPDIGLGRGDTSY